MSNRTDLKNVVIFQYVPPTFVELLGDKSVLSLGLV